MCKILVSDVRLVINQCVQQTIYHMFDGIEWDTMHKSVLR